MDKLKQWELDRDARFASGLCAFCDDPGADEGVDNQHLCLKHIAEFTQ